MQFHYKESIGRDSVSALHVSGRSRRIAAGLIGLVSARGTGNVTVFDKTSVGSSASSRRGHRRQDVHGSRLPEGVVAIAGRMPWRPWMSSRWPSLTGSG